MLLHLQLHQLFCGDYDVGSLRYSWQCNFFLWLLFSGRMMWKLVSIYDRYILFGINMFLNYHIELNITSESECFIWRTAIISPTYNGFTGCKSIPIILGHSLDFFKRKMNFMWFQVDLTVLFLDIHIWNPYWIPNEPV